MAGGQQLRLLLWKDYLIRKRKWITLAGVVWATGIMFSLYVVRMNVDNEDLPSCQFAARALPSAGVINFLQSFICNVNNECSPMDQFEEIPAYGKSKLTQIMRKASPFMNDTVLEVASSMPNALKLLATMSDIVDEPTFVEFSKNGLKVEDLFKNPTKVRKYLVTHLKIKKDVAKSVMEADISFQGIFKGNLNRCNPQSISTVLKIKNEDHLNNFTKNLCALPNKDLQKMFMDLVMEIDFSKYIKMFGDMYYKLSGDNRLLQVGDLMTAIVRFTNLQHFLSLELRNIFTEEESDFSYINLSLVSKLMDLFKPTFGDTESYRSVRSLTDTAVISLQYMDRILAKPPKNETDEDTNIDENTGMPDGLKRISEILSNVATVFESTMDKNSTIDPFNVLTQIMSFILNFLPERQKHDVLFYSTLLAKLMESAQKIITINMHIENITYNVTLRNPEGVKILKDLPPFVVGKAFDALSDAERTQILTSKINNPGQVFCDANKLASFFVVSKTEADSLKLKLCNDAWKNFIVDLIQSFGIYKVRFDINMMASLLIQETIGTDTSDQLYTIEQDFEILKNFSFSLISMDAEKKPELDWYKVLRLEENSELMKVMKKKARLGNQMLITVHGGLAKEIIRQNPILAYKLAPVLIHMTTLVKALNHQLDSTPIDIALRVKEMYGDIIVTLLMTGLDEYKTYRSLSTPGYDIFCNGVDTTESYLNIPPNVDKEKLVATLCNATIAIEKGLRNDSIVAKAIQEIKNKTDTSGESVDWIILINSIKNVYIKLDQDYPYVFNYASYGMNEDKKKKVDDFFTELKDFWFGIKNLQRGLHLSLKLGFRFLDLLDRGIFNIANPIWLKIKYAFSVATGPLNVLHDVVNLVTALLLNSTYSSDLPPTTVNAVSTIIPNIPQLIIDSVNVLIADNTELEPIIFLMNADPAWPCSGISISEFINLTPKSKDAVTAIETLLCMDEDVQMEWVAYLDFKKGRIPKIHNWNSTQYEPEVFLKLSAVFDYLISDAKAIQEATEYIMNDKSTDEHVGMLTATKYAANMLNVTNDNAVMRKFFTNVDTVLNAINTSSVNDVSTVQTWQNYLSCSNGTIIDDDCRDMGRAAWKYSLKTFSVILENIAKDLMTYFTEINEPNANLLQIFGFTRNTGLYMLYDRTADFLTVLINSYWDYNFMSRIRRASFSSFWDCNGVMDALNPPPGSPITEVDINKVRPFICPSFLYWISFPIGDNTLIDIVTKPQHLLFRRNIQDASSNFEQAYINSMELLRYMDDVAKQNKTIIKLEDLELNTLRQKLEQGVNSLVNYKIDKINSNYILFNDLNKKTIASQTYLTQIVALVNKLHEALDQLDINNLGISNDEEIAKLVDELRLIKELYKRRVVDIISIHFDLFTDVLWNNDGSYGFLEAMDSMCEEVNNTTASKVILAAEERTKLQICTKQYKILYNPVIGVLNEDYNDAKKSLDNLVEVLLTEDDGEVTDVFAFLNQRKEIIYSLKKSVKYSSDLGLAIYLKYLQSNVKGYGVLLTFLSGDDWWSAVKDLYNGPYAQNFLGFCEQIFAMAQDLLNNFDRIHLVRLLRDISINNTDSFCMNNITLSDYIPDATGKISELKRQICNTDKVELFREIPPLLIASQGYENSLKMSKVIDYEALKSDISKTETRLELIKAGPEDPNRPPWVTDDNINKFKDAVIDLLSKEKITKMVFLVLTNGVDAGTLFLNNSQCTLCSQLTTWFKQLNLQLFKKQEYDNLLCHMDIMTLEDIYYTLKNDFHWDMAIQELISTRNYTKLELNKSINEFLELVKLHLLEDIAANTTKVAECLARNVTKNAFGNATLVFTILSHTMRLVRAELPHLSEIISVRNIPYFKQLSTELVHNLNVMRPLLSYLKPKNDLTKELMKEIRDKDVVSDILNSEINLRVIRNTPIEPSEEYIQLYNINWSDTCDEYNCSTILEAIENNLNYTLIDKDLPPLQTEEFWRFTFISEILRHIEVLISHTGRLFGVASHMDIARAMDRKLDALIDMAITILMDENMDSILYSLQGIVNELHPLLKGTDLEHDLVALGSGLTMLHEFKGYLLEEDLKIEVSSMFPDPDRVETALANLGIKNTNFWSIAAPRIHAGYIMFRPILTSKEQNFHISNYVCKMEYMSKIIAPGNLDVVTNDDVYAAVIEQFCGLDEEVGVQIIPVLMQNFNFSLVIDKVTSTLLQKLYSASDLTEGEGVEVMEQFPKMAALLPAVQDSIGGIMETLGNDPLFEALKDFSNVGNLLYGSNFMSSAGKMLCGKPFNINVNRFLRSIIQNKDMDTKPNQAQLDGLPTEFCRSLYTQIVGLEGGKIVWSIVKPLLMGKILYTPTNPTIDKIIEKANFTFSKISRVTGLLHSFAAAFPSVDKLTDHQEGIAVLQRVMTSPKFEELRSMLIGDHIDVPDMDVDGIFGQFGDLKGIGNLLTKASDLLRCINLDRFHPQPDEFELAHEAAKLLQVNEFTAGLIFLNTKKKNNALTNVEYKIRMDIENVPTTKRLMSYMWTPGPESNFIENLRYFRGFVQIQDMVDKAIIELSHNSSRRVKRETEMEDVDWAVYTQEEPYPCYKKDYFQNSLYESQALIVAFFFALVFTVTSVVRFIVADKESGNTMLMSVMGVDLKYHTLSWFIASFIEVTVTMVCVTLMLHFGLVLPRTDPTLLFVLLFIFGISVLSFCYMMSKIFTSASFAAICTVIAYMVSFMPFVLILSLEAVINSSMKMIICLSMSSSLCYALLYIARYEAVGVGAQWGDIWLSPIEGEDMNIISAAAMLVVDAAIYLCIGWLIDRYFGIKTIQSNINNCTTNDEKAGVSIVNVTKIYGEGTRRAKLALDNVSMELHKGQITTLLGHNGAGKTTLTNILTGMLRPTKGHVTIRSERGFGTQLGVCPQRDVLFEYMSAREHVALYAQIKSGKSADEVRDEVDRMLEVLSLGAICDEPVVRLSGGTRRRLCVALAFVAKPRLVSLDEPTSGVDPAARRDIWSMIVKLKEDRTVLLTTHHLDEAELLSDQIIIMHKGQIHTTGSPIEIKRSLGNGYKLTVIYPNQKEQMSDEPWTQGWVDDDCSLEEKTKQVLAVTRDVVKNANLADVNGLEVELTLPFFDANGVNNDFLKLCTTLEAAQNTLGFKSYSLDCSSLEQVFFDICHQTDIPQNTIELEDSPSKSASTSSIRTDRGPLVPAEGPVRGSAFDQFAALMRARYLHHIRNKWLVFLLLILPSLFVAVAMGFSMLRPPADNEISLRLDDQLYNGSTEYLVSQPSVYNDSIDISPVFASDVMYSLQHGKQTKDWTDEDTPTCKCTETHQQCDIGRNLTESRPEMMILPNVNTLNTWITNSFDNYIEKRYGGYTSALKNNITNLIAWYNNKGHHALPAFINSLNNAILRTVADVQTANITTYTHPMKISKEQISKDTVYQHVADAGVSALVVIAYGLISAGSAIYLVSARRRQEKRLQMLCGVSPTLYWGTALTWDMMIMVINMVITAAVMLAFGFPVFVAKNNLPAICVLFILYGFACGTLIHLTEKLFNDPSMANMILFCSNCFFGLAGITVLLILDIISESDATDNARWILHKIFLLSPQFVLGDGLLEIAKNTVQSEVLAYFGMDTYRDPFNTDLLLLHYSYLVVVGIVLFFVNLAAEYGYFQLLYSKFQLVRISSRVGELEPMEVTAERARVRASRHDNHEPLRVNTLGNINRGFVLSECKKNSIQRVAYAANDVVQCVGISKVYPALGGQRIAVRDLTLGIPPGQCTALLGQNGAGKSTTFAMLTGEIRPTSGQIYLSDKEVDSTELCRGLISYCPQTDSIDPLITVRETLDLYCRLRGIADKNDVIRRTLDMFDLMKYAEVRSGALSGGNKRKLCTAIAFMARTPLVLLDEPTSGMDPASRACVSRGVRVSCHGGRAVLLSTHALDDARRLAARVALVRGGDLVALASLDDCLNRFGGGYIVQCRVCRSARDAWRRVRALAPHASLRVLHQHTIHFLMPNYATVDKKDVTTRLSDIFRLMAELQSTCDIEDYTVNQSSLEQMFLSFTDKAEMDMEPVEIEPLPSPEAITRVTEDVDSITAL
ncbi:hypothetical protein K1T71_011613 [Dendrolimus kikuchii]|uniref:Uncharacterized protein n=1 Tax=Dendrolimus kikuchii TaxID=765133 RepID=A0ACC1CLJ7_9NEOP|nr:hypothetical protein K1T71_011613 [Dendrolimus kikuchii]